jgi:hypothetical protein
MTETEQNKIHPTDYYVIADYNGITATLSVDQPAETFNTKITGWLKFKTPKPTKSAEIKILQILGSEVSANLQI